MDKETRGYLESCFNKALQEEMTKDIEWVQDLVGISSLKDLILGYVIGQMQCSAEATILIRSGEISNEDVEAVAKMIQRRVPEITGKIMRELNV